MIWLIGNRGMLGTEVEALLKGQNVPFIATDQEIDIGNPDELEKFTTDIPLAWIINCAAYTAVDQAEDEPDLAFRTNASGSLNIAKIAEAKQAKLIHLSTDYVFDGAKEGTYTETDPPNPIGVYGRSKLAGEQHISKTLQQHIIIRTGWLYGRHGHNFVLTMLRLMKERDEVRVVEDQYGSPTYAPDLAQFILGRIQEDSQCYGLYHFTNEGKTSWYDFACKIKNLATNMAILQNNCRVISIPSDQFPTKATRPLNSYLSKEKVKTTFNITIRPWESALVDFMSELNTRKF